MFDYKQRPFSRTITEEDYNHAVGVQPKRRKTAEVKAPPVVSEVIIRNPLVLNEDALSE